MSNKPLQLHGPACYGAADDQALLRGVGESSWRSEDGQGWYIADSLMQFIRARVAGTELPAKRLRAPKRNLTAAPPKSLNRSP